MDVKPLCILQMRSGSTRLPNKMLLTLGGETLAERGWRIACEAFGEENCVVAIPATDAVMRTELERIGATIFEYDGDTNDVLGRFHACAHAFRWSPDSVIVRFTPDDPWKSPVALRRVANGERLPVEIGGEAFTLAMLDRAHSYTQSVFEKDERHRREHITYALFDTLPPPAPAGQVWTVDTEDDLFAARKRWARENGHAMVEA